MYCIPINVYCTLTSDHDYTMASGSICAGLKLKCAVIDINFKRCCTVLQKLMNNVQCSQIVIKTLQKIVYRFLSWGSYFLFWNILLCEVDSLVGHFEQLNASIAATHHYIRNSMKIARYLLQFLAKFSIPQ